VLSTRPRRGCRAAGAASWRLVLVLVGVAGIAAIVACAETRRGIGDACLKNDDCLSGVCSGLTCASQPPLLDGSPENVRDAATEAAPIDGGADASDGSDDALPADAASGDADEGG
jgi:hypothetical protein